jgi:phage recombination protein Bet
MENQIVTYIANQTQVQLDPDMVKACLVRGEKEAVTGEEITLFMNLCAYRKLNPFLNEAYLVKFKGSPAQLIISQDVFIKRATSNQHFKGFDEGVIIQKENEIDRRRGGLVLKGENLIGGWAEGFRDDWDRPLRKEVLLSEYHKGQATWNGKPATMIIKVARSQMLRQLFPDELTGLYDEAEGATITTIDAEFRPVKEPVKMPQSKSQQTAQKAEDVAGDINESPGETGTIPNCPECGKPLAKTDEAAAKIIDYCTQHNKPVKCYACQKK